MGAGVFAWCSTGVERRSVLACVGEMRWLLVVVLASCEPNLAHKPLPDLVAAPKSTAARTERQLLLVRGETLIWDVHWKGFTIARAELVVGDREVSSRVKTGKLASSLASILHEATSTLEPTRATSVRERFVIDGETTHVVASFRDAMYVLDDDKRRAVPGGNIGHTIHSALGWLRAWAEPGARGGYLFVLHVGELYKLEFAEPIVEAESLRIDCRIVPPDEEPVTITLWLATNADRVPTRFEIGNANVRLTAELVDRTTLD
jgi:hypothetical protein